MDFGFWDFEHPVFRRFDENIFGVLFAQEANMAAPSFHGDQKVFIAGRDPGVRENDRFEDLFACQALADPREFRPHIAPDAVELMAAKARDVGESDTVTIVTDMLADVFGYEKYSEITSEYSIRGTFCDLATKIDGTLQTLIEVKAIGLELKDSHVKQAVDYAANQGVDWVLLTNGISWRVYHIIFAKPIDQELVIAQLFHLSC